MRRFKLYLLLDWKGAERRILGFRKSFWLGRSAVEIYLGRKMDASALLVLFVSRVIHDGKQQSRKNSNSKTYGAIYDRV